MAVTKEKLFVGTCLTGVYGVAVLFTTIALLLSLMCEQTEKLEKIDYALTVTSICARVRHHDFATE